MQEHYHLQHYKLTKFIEHLWWYWWKQVGAFKTPPALKIRTYGKSVIKFGEWIIWRQWRQWRQWVAPMDAPLATMATSIGANGDRHWLPLAPIKWRHLIHSVAILSSQSPFRVSGSFGDPMAPIDPVAPLTTMATIHLIQWHQLRQ